MTKMSWLPSRLESNTIHLPSAESPRFSTVWFPVVIGRASRSDTLPLRGIGIAWMLRRRMNRSYAAVRPSAETETEYASRPVVSLTGKLASARPVEPQRIDVARAVAIGDEQQAAIRQPGGAHVE